MNDTPPPATAAPAPVTLWQIFQVFFVIGITSFGGGIVAYLRETLVKQKRWLTDDEFLAALEIGQTLPGLNATNVSVIVGKRLRGPWGSLAAVTGILVPGVVIIMLLGLLYQRFHHSPEIAAVLAGVAAAAVGLLLEVTLQIGRKQLTNLRDLVVVVLVFWLVGVLHVSLLVVLVTIAPVAIWFHRPRPPAVPSSLETSPVI